MKSIEDYLICDNCDGDMKEYSVDEIEFGIGNSGHYIVDCWCPNCNNSQRAYIKFNYNIIQFGMI